MDDLLTRRPPPRPTPLATLVAVHGIALGTLVLLGRGRGWATVWTLLVLVATAAVVRAQRPPRRRRAGLALVATGLAGTVAGAGIGVPHAVEVGATPTAVAGLVALVAGLALAVVGTVVLVRGTRRWQKVLAVPVGAAVVAFGAFPVTLGVLVTNAPPGCLGDRTPASLGLRFEVVTLATDDGVRLDGWYVPSSNGAAVVLLPGAGGARSGELDHAAVLARHGYGVLLLDPRGQGSSGGDAMLWGWHGDADLAPAVTYLAGRRDVVADRIGVVGRSMGGEQAIGAAGTDDRILAVVAEGATARGPGTEGDDGDWPARLVGWTATHVADLLTSAHAPPSLRSAVEAAAPRPMLLIAAGEVPEEQVAGRHLQQAAPDAVELWVVPGSGHTDALGTDPAGWERRVVDFLDRSLGRT